MKNELIKEITEMDLERTDDLIALATFLSYLRENYGKKIDLITLSNFAALMYAILED